ncbi:hypothetical protein JYT82_00290 [bacterium AH-315-K20]|nr:hypothetical protein [bacterium AH-315-K20]
MDKARDLIEQRIESGELDRIAEDALRDHVGDSSGNSPESSASIRAP